MTKEELQRYTAIKHERRQIEAELEKIKATLYGPRSQQITGMPSAPSKPGSALEEAVIEHSEDLAALQEYYEGLLVRLATEQLAIEKAIESLEPTARTLLRYRYIDDRKWEEVCVLMSYSWRQAHRLHAAALKELRGATND